MAPYGLTHTLVASVTTAQEATMHSQLNHIIARQHHAELIQNAGRARLIADAKTRRPERHPVAGLKSFRQRISAAVAYLAPRESRGFVEP
jgi:hypothetical protein